MPLDLSRLPRERILAECFPGEPVEPDGKGFARFRCSLPSHEHHRGDQRPSLKVHVETGWHACTSVGAAEEPGKTWRALVTTLLGAGRWASIIADLPKSSRSHAERWAELQTETAWTERYNLTSELSARYLRYGRRCPGDPVSDTVVGLWHGDTLHGAKFRLPDGERWRVGAVAKQDPEAKYANWKGTKLKHLCFLGDLVRPGATIVFVGGEKDALVSASHLDLDRWGPTAGCVGEGAVPSDALKLCREREVVVAYDGDEAGHHGAWKLYHMLKRVARSVRVAVLPETTPPGSTKPGWDAADVVLHLGAAKLAELLEAALPEPPASWEPKRKARAPEGAVGPGVGKAFLAPGEPHGPAGTTRPPGATHPLDSWREENGHVLEIVITRDGPSALIRFEGTARVERVDTLWAEEPSAPGGWEEEHLFTYRLRSGARTTTRQLGPGASPFLSVVEGFAPGGLCCYSREDQVKLYQFAHRRSDPRRTEVRSACGPTDLGWLSAPGIVVKDGKVSRTPFPVEPPVGHAQDLSRYRLAILDPGRLAEVGRWVVDHLLRCDHEDGRYTLPLLAAFLQGPLWAYLPGLASWQRSALFLQGPSGIGKSQLARYFWCFWGSFLSPQGLSTWGSTSTFIEQLLYRVVAAPVFVTDWKLANFADRRALQAAFRILQSYGDRSSRGRCAPSASTKRKNDPRATLVIDGENLPAGEQSTVGRLVVVRAEASGPTRRCATANPDVLDQAMVDDLPGLTAEWIAFVQREVEEIWVAVALAHDLFDEQLAHGSTNRSRIVRNYAVQHATVNAFAIFLAKVCGVEGAVASLCPRSLEVHVGHASLQLSTVVGESASEQFVAALRGLLDSREARLIDVSPQAWKTHTDPFPGAPETKPVLGLYDADRVYIWPDAALPLVQAHVSRGGGRRIQSERAELTQMLRQDGYLISRKKKQYGGRRRRTWEFDLKTLVGEEE